MRTMLLAIDNALVVVRTAVRTQLCALRGHDTVLHYEDRRVMLRCTSCLHDSPGWEIGRPRKRVVVQSLSSLL